MYKKVKTNKNIIEKTTFIIYVSFIQIHNIKN